MTPLIARVFALSIGACFAVSAFAADGSDYSKLRAEIAKKAPPEMPAIVGAVSGPIPGFVELEFEDGSIAYSDSTGGKLFFGTIVDLDARRNLTAERRDALASKAVSALSEAGAVVDVRGSGSRKLIVFADPNCGYCKKLEAELASAVDVTIVTYPFGMLGPDSAAKTRDILCASDRVKAWHDHMLRSASPAKAAASCKDLGAENAALARKLGVNSTPTLLFPDGRRGAGLMSWKAIDARLGPAKK